jgi:hypothetical protein
MPQTKFRQRLCELFHHGGTLSSEMNQKNSFSASYRSSILAAFGDVEDQLSALRVLEQESANGALTPPLAEDGTQVSCRNDCRE